MESTRTKTPKSFEGLKKNADFLLNIIKMETRLDLKNKTRRREYVDARAIAFYILKSEMNMSLEAIGRVFNKNHATVLHGIRLFYNLIETDKAFKNKFNKILFLFKKEKGQEISFVDSDDEIKKLKNLYEERIKVLLLENDKLKIKFEDVDKHPYKDIKDLIYQRLKPKHRDEFKRKVNAILNGM
jgi:cystathionine beta-lyase/cystathionine gamma-synthase